MSHAWAWVMSHARSAICLSTPRRIPVPLPVPAGAHSVPQSVMFALMFAPILDVCLRLLHDRLHPALPLFRTAVRTSPHSSGIAQGPYASHSRTPRDGSSSTAPRCQPLPAFLEGQSRTHLDESCPLWSDPDARRGEAHISPPVTSSLVTSSQLCPDPHRPSAALAVLSPTGLACLLAHQVAGSPCWSLEAGSGGFCNRMRGLAVKQCYCRNDSVGTRKTTQVSEPGLLASVRQCSSATRSPFPPSRTGEHPPPPISHYLSVCTEAAHPIYPPPLPPPRTPDNSGARRARRGRL